MMGSLGSRLMSATLISPRYPASTVPGAFTIERPTRMANPERGCTRPTMPCGIADGDPRRHQLALTGGQFEVDRAEQIDAGIAVVEDRRIGRSRSNRNYRQRGGTRPHRLPLAACQTRAHPNRPGYRGVVDGASVVVVTGFRAGRPDRAGSGARRTGRAWHWPFAVLLPAAAATLVWMGAW